MKSVTIVFLAVLAMSFAQGDKVHVVEQSSNQGQGLNIVPDTGFYKPSVQNPGDIVIQNPDPFFSQPSAGPGSTGNNGNPPPYPYKKYDNPYARGGK